MSAGTKEKHLPAYLRLRDELLDEIRTGKIKKGAQLPSEGELSRQYRIHRHTVRNSLHLLEQAEVITSQPGKGWFVRSADKGDPGERTKVIGIYGVSLFYMHSPMMAFLLNTLLKESRKNNFELRFLCTRDFYDLVEKGVGKDQLDWLLFSGPNSYHLPSLNALKEQNIKVFAFNRRLAGTPFPYVTTDQYAGAREVSGRLVAAGHRKIGYIGSALSNSSYVAERWHGFCDALTDAGIEVEERRVLRISDHEKHADAVWKFMAENKDMTALYVAGEVFHNAVFEYLFQNQMRIPDDISIGAFDKVDPGWGASMSIVTAEPPFDEMIREVFRQMDRIDRGEKPESRVFVPHITDGQSIKNINEVKQGPS